MTAHARGPKRATWIGRTGCGCAAASRSPLITLYGVGTIVGGGHLRAARQGRGTSWHGRAYGLPDRRWRRVPERLLLRRAQRARFPVSAGEAHYVRAAFGTRWLGPLVGALVVLTGTVSAATLANAVGAFLVELLGTPAAWNVGLVVLALASLAAWGITESVVVAAAITVVELGGLLAVLVLRGQRARRAARRMARRGATGHDAGLERARLRRLPGLLRLHRLRGHGQRRRGGRGAGAQPADARSCCRSWPPRSSTCSSAWSRSSPFLPPSSPRAAFRWRSSWVPTRPARASS